MGSYVSFCGITWNASAGRGTVCCGVCGRVEVLTRWVLWLDGARRWLGLRCWRFQRHALTGEVRAVCPRCVS